MAAHAHEIYICMYGGALAKNHFDFVLFFSQRRHTCVYEIGGCRLLALFF